MAGKSKGDDPAKVKARVSRYINSPKGKATRRAYCLLHSKEAVQRNKEWRERNPGRALASRQAHYAANKAHIVQKVNDWNEANPEGQRTRRRNYRARFNGAEGSHTGDDIKALFVQQLGRCIYCEIELGEDYHVDHIVALSKGGSNWPSNLQLTCGPCNNRKRATDPAEFARRRLTSKE